jgi:hypothetical protein
MIVCLIDPSKRQDVDVSGSTVVDGYTIPVIHSVGVNTEGRNTEMSMLIHFRYSIEDQYAETEKILRSKFKGEFVKQIMDYIKKKNNIDYELIGKTFYTTGYKVYVSGYSWSISIMVYKK